MIVIRIGRSKATTVALVLDLLLVIMTATATATGTSANIKEHSIPTFTLSDLRSIAIPTLAGIISNDDDRKDRGQDLRETLSTTGLLAVHLEDKHARYLNHRGATGRPAFQLEDPNALYSHNRGVALDGLCSCIDHPGFLKLDQTHELTMTGSSTSRTSVATATVGLDHPLPLPKGLEDTCGTDVLDAMEGLRDVVASVSKAFVSALDEVFIKSDPVTGRPYSDEFNPRPPTTLLRDESGKSYESITDIVKVANHLEHFHVYTHQEGESENSSSDFARNDVAWDWHTDAGLFLVFVPAWVCSGSSDNVDDSFYYRDTDGTTVRAKFDGGKTAIVMMGQGAQDWLDLRPSKNQPQNLLLKATTHSVRWSEPEAGFEGIPRQRRAWYGMMNLVPETALIYGGKSLRDVKKSLSLSYQHKTDYQSPTEPLFSSEMSLGCGGAPVSLMAPKEEQELAGFFEVEEGRTTARRQRHLSMQDPSMCNNVTNFYCWMTCMDIPKVDQAELFLEAGYSLYCVEKSIMGSSGTSDSKTLATAHDACVGVHNMACTGEWEKTVEAVPAVVINVTAVESGSKIEYPFCYSGTTMYMEGFQWTQSSTCVIYLFPSWVLNSIWKYFTAVIGTILLAIGLEKFIQQRRKAMASMEAGTARLVASAAFYGVQLSIGYMLMLIIMIYSVLLFLSVILGLVIGHVLFNAGDAIWPIHESPHLTKDVGIEEDDDETSEIEAKFQRKSCCAATANMLLNTELGEERAIHEGSTHCQEFESENDPEYYGSFENGSNHETPPAFVAASKKTETKRKPRNPGVPEGSTPCCQHGS